jgi:hypothetical protein
MSEVVMALRQTLGIVAQFVLTQQANRAIKTDLDAAIHEHVFKPFGALVAVVD